MSSPTAMSDAVLKAKRLIDGSGVMIFSKMGCPYCEDSKELLQQKQKEYEAKGTPFSLDIYELDGDRKCLLAPLIGSRDLTYAVVTADCAAIQDYLLERTKKRTVPRIFFAGDHIDSGDKLLASVKPGAKEPLDGFWLKKAVDYTAAQNS